MQRNLKIQVSILFFIISFKLDEINKFFSILDELDSESEQAVDMIHREDYEEALDTIEQLEKEVLNLKNLLVERDMETRQELTETYRNMMKKVEQDWR